MSNTQSRPTSDHRVQIDHRGEGQRIRIPVQRVELRRQLRRELRTQENFEFKTSQLFTLSFNSQIFRIVQKFVQTRNQRGRRTIPYIVLIYYTSCLLIEVFINQRKKVTKKERIGEKKYLEMNFDNFRWSTVNNFIWRLRTVLSHTRSD